MLAEVQNLMKVIIILFNIWKTAEITSPNGGEILGTNLTYYLNGGFSNMMLSCIKEKQKYKIFKEMLDRIHMNGPSLKACQ